MEIASLVIRIGANLADLNTGMKRATDAISGFDRTLQGIGRAVASYFTAEAVIGFVQSIMQAADQLVNLSSATGHSIEELQRMQAVAESTGSSLDTFTSASANMTRSLISAADDVTNAYRDLGLSQQALRDMSADEQFRAIVDALRGVTDESKQAADAQAIFGRGAKEMLPAIRQGYADLARDVTVAGEAQVRALAAAQSALENLKREITTGATIALGSLVQAGQEFAALDWKQKFIAIMEGPSVVSALANKASAEYTVAQEKMQAATEKTADVIKSEAAVVEGVTASQVEGLKELLDLTDRMWGTKVADNAKLYVDALRLMNGELPKLREGQALYTSEIVKSLGQLIELGQTGTQTYTDLTDLLHRLNDAKPAFDLPSRQLDAGMLMNAVPADIGDQAQSSAVQVVRATQEMNKAWEDQSAFLAEQAAEQTKTLDAYVADLHKTKDDTVGAVDTMSGAWRRYGQAAADAIKVAVPRDFDWAGAYRAAGLFTQDISGALSGSTFGMARTFSTPMRSGGAIPGFAGGTNGFQDFGSGTLVTLHGREKVTPWGADEGGGAVVNVNVSGVLLSNNPAAKEELRRYIDDSVTTGIKRSRKFSY